MLTTGVGGPLGPKPNEQPGALIISASTSTSLSRLLSLDSGPDQFALVIKLGASFVRA